MKEQKRTTKAPESYLSRLLLMIVSFVFLCQVAVAQNRTVSGTVTDMKGEPIIGATVMEKGTSNGVTTDLDGKFKFQVKASSIIEVRFMGFITQEFSSAERMPIRVILKDDAQQLEEVVIVGYGIQKKESVVGAISSVGSKELLKSTSGNISQAIAGRIPGLVTSQSSGAPGNDNASIYIRGRASFAGDNQPLTMVDGVERDFTQVSPDDIETISVLKDASATAVYGVRGANGVILVTTKRGRESKPVVSLSANFQVSTPTREDTYLNSYESVKLLEEALANDGMASQYSSNDIEMFRKSCAGELSSMQSQLYPNVDWYDEILNKTAYNQRYNVNVQGGTKRMRYFTSVEYYNQNGLYKDNNNYDYGKSSNVSYNRYSFRANLDFNLTKQFTASVNFGTRFEERKGPNVDESVTNNEVFYELNHTPGWLFPVKYENGFYGGNSQHQNNIAAKLAKGGFYQDTHTVNETNLILKHDLSFVTKGLDVKGTVSFDYDSFYDRRFKAGFATYELIDKTRPDLDSSFNRFNEDEELAYAGNTQNTWMKLYMELAFNYVRTFKEKHDVTGLILYNQNDYRYQAELAKRYQGVAARATYTYDHRYMAEINCAYNGSENFRKGKRFGFFPSVSAGWMLSNEKFMQPLTDSWLDMLKIRASYGEVGNDVYQENGGDVRFLYVESWTQMSNAYRFGTTNTQTGIYEGRYPNYDVTWERAKKYNAAVEVSVLKGMFSLNVDYFMEKRNDILTSYLTKPSFLAVTMAPGNLGKTENKGYEIELKHNGKVGKVNYFVNASYSHARNKIINMDEAAGKAAYLKREGNPIGQYMGLICEGFVSSSDIASGKLPTSGFSTLPLQVGDLKYKDMNGDGTINDMDVTCVGYSEVPENSFSISLGADWKGWAFSMMFQGVTNVSRYYDAEAMFAFVDGGKVKKHHLNRWNPALSESENMASAKYPLLHYDGNGNHNQLHNSKRLLDNGSTEQMRNSYFLKNGNFVRLKNVELSYTFPSALTKKWYMSDLRLFVNASNLVTWDKLDDLTDPEQNGSNMYPIMKTVNFGLNVKF